MKRQRWLSVVVATAIVLSVLGLGLTLRTSREAAAKAAEVARDNHTILAQIHGLVEQQSQILSRLNFVDGDLVTQTAETLAVESQIQAVLASIQAASATQGAELARLQAQIQCAVTATSQLAAGRCLVPSLSAGVTTFQVAPAPVACPVVAPTTTAPAATAPAATAPATTAPATTASPAASATPAPSGNGKAPAVSQSASHGKP